MMTEAKGIFPKKLMIDTKNFNNIIFIEEKKFEIIWIKENITDKKPTGIIIPTSGTTRIFVKTASTFNLLKWNAAIGIIPICAPKETDIINLKLFTKYLRILFFGISDSNIKKLFILFVK